jgi:hypothetical protein
MSDKIEPIIHKLTEAVPEPGKAAHAGHSGPPDPAPAPADLKQHNAGVQPGVKDRMVDIGRGEETAGRGGHR